MRAVNAFKAEPILRQGRQTLELLLHETEEMKTDRFKFRFIPNCNLTTAYACQT